MAAMSMNKAIHGAFRRDLDRFEAALQGFTDGDTTRARQLATAWANFEDQLGHHHRGEHDIAWPWLEKLGVSRDLLEAMDEEHDVMASTLADAAAAIGVLGRSATRADADAALAAVVELAGVTVQHLDHEEAALEKVYLDNVETPEMKEMGKGFAKVTPARGGRFFAWVLDGATPDQRAAVTGTIPGPVLGILTGVFGRGYRKNVAPVWKA